MIFADQYQSIRSARKRDIALIYNMLRGSIKKDEIVKRTKAEIEKNINNFFLFEVDNQIIGCVCLYLFPEHNSAELACLHVVNGHEARGVGQKLMSYAIQQAEYKKVKSVFAMSTQAFTFFQKKGGFKEGQLKDLPSHRQQSYLQSGRAGRILVKDLNLGT